MPARLTVRELMFAIGLFGLILGAFRMHFSLGSFLSGVMAMAWVRTSSKIEHRRAMGRPIHNVNRILFFIDSFLIASLLLIISLVPGLFLLPGFIPGRHGSDYGVDPLIGVMIGAILGWTISVMMRRWLW